MITSSHLNPNTVLTLVMASTAVFEDFSRAFVISFVAEPISFSCIVIPNIKGGRNATIWPSFSAQLSYLLYIRAQVDASVPS